MLLRASHLSDWNKYKKIFRRVCASCACKIPNWIWPNYGAIIMWGICPLDFTAFSSLFSNINYGVNIKWRIWIISPHRQCPKGKVSPLNKKQGHGTCRKSCKLWFLISTIKIYFICNHRIYELAINERTFISFFVE